jgi:hypothetical protein
MICHIQPSIHNAACQPVPPHHARHNWHSSPCLLSFCNKEDNPRDEISNITMAGAISSAAVANVAAAAAAAAAGFADTDTDVATVTVDGTMAVNKRHAMVNRRKQAVWLWIP